MNWDMLLSCPFTHTSQWPKSFQGDCAPIVYFATPNGYYIKNKSLEFFAVRTLKFWSSLFFQRYFIGMTYYIIL
jgi:hypothetical protein